ncbi:MAG: nfo 1 [Bryobacterales bacterium]|jgi:L-ribulose-5-phosphate 3-epimerase|nr:nfo 1 [Bryobacterales bacterium]
MRRRDYLKLLPSIALACPALTSAAPGSKARFRSAICAYSFRNLLQAKTMTYADLIRLAADLQVDGIDFTTYWLPDTNDATLFELKKLAYRSGISLYTIGVRVRLAQPTPELQAAEIESLRKWLDVAQRLGASHMRVFGGAVPKGATDDQAVAWAVETLKRGAEEASKKGIVLGVEDDGGITTDAKRTVEIVTKTDSPWAAINLDVGNFRDDAYNQIALCAPYASNVHFKSEVHLGGKAEPADYNRILAILAKQGYRGYLALEYEANSDPMKAVPELVSKMRAAVQLANSA